MRNELVNKVKVILLVLLIEIAAGRWQIILQGKLLNERQRNVYFQRALSLLFDIGNPTNNR